MSAFGVNSASRGFLRLADRWGLTRGSNPIRGFTNWAQPVTQIERWRDDQEGSLYGLTAFTPGFGVQIGPILYDAEYPSVCIGNLEQDVYIHRMNISFNRLRGVGATSFNYNERFEIFTPLNPYSPCANNTVGPFFPGLITRDVLNVGGTFAIAGTNPLNLVDAGQHHGFTVNIGATRYNGDTTRFIGDVVGGEYVSGGAQKAIADLFAMQNTLVWDDPPLKIPSPFALAVQRTILPDRPIAEVMFQPATLRVSIMYTEIPDRRGQ